MNNKFEQKLNIFLIKSGFIRKVNRWSKNTNIGASTALLLCEIQKSNYSNNFYINFGVYYSDKSIGRKSFPKSTDWHFVARYEQILFNKFSAGISNELSFEESEVILENIRNVILPYLHNFSNSDYMINEFLPNYNFESIWLQHFSINKLRDFLLSCR